MLECAICGLLSLNALSCPACGSQNLIDLASDDEDPNMPSEVPGLDDAVISLYELEGIEQIEDTDEIKVPIPTKSSTNSSLPFGYSGQSNIHLSRLPFGIGSQAEGVPFDSEDDSEMESISPSAVETDAPIQTIQKPLVESAPEEKSEQPNTLTMVRVEPLPEPSIRVESEESFLPKEIEEAHPSFLIPDEWKITAEDPNLDEIYSSPETVVEVVHQSEDDVVVYNHQEIEQSNTDSVQPSFSQDVSSLSLELHPAKALNVDVGVNTDLGSELERGYFAIANNSWAEAAISFQKMASRMHGDSAVFNNYGLSLLQRAIEMAKDDDESIQMMASSQFESAILALREAAKSDPDESIILLNLSHALLVSGRAGKALKIVQVHNSRNPSSLEGANLEAAALVSIGQSVNAKNLLSSHKGDSIIDENLSRLL